MLVRVCERETENETIEIEESKMVYSNFSFVVKLWTLRTVAIAIVIGIVHNVGLLNEQNESGRKVQ